MSSGAVVGSNSGPDPGGVEFELFFGYSEVTFTVEKPCEIFWEDFTLNEARFAVVQLKNWEK